MIPQETQNKTTCAWVVFSGEADLLWLKTFRPGFRHCFVVLNDGQHWITLDPLSHYTDIKVHDGVPMAFDLPLWLADQGRAVVPAVINVAKKPAPWAVFSCVEAVKRVLGLHRIFIFTPWQLYRHLTKHYSPVSSSLYECSSSEQGKQGDAQTNLKGDYAWEV